MRQDYAETVSTIRELRAQWRRSADAYHEQRRLEDTSAAEKDRARQARYYASRRAKKGL